MINRFAKQRIRGANENLNKKSQTETPKGNQDKLSPAEAKVMFAQLTRRFCAYGTDQKQSVLQLAMTLVPFIALLTVMAAISRSAYWLTLLLAIPAGGLLVRLFIFQHDCGHGSFLRSRAMNDWLGRALSVLTLTPYDNWKKTHAIHHATIGNLDRRGRGDVRVLTVCEYVALGPGKRLGYRIYRNPFFQVLFGAPLKFLFLRRVPFGRKFRDKVAFRSIMSLNVALIVVFGLLMASVGVLPILLAYLPVVIIASWIGNWLFYVQHQFEEADWSRDCDWDFHAATINGTSYFDLPPILQWFTGNIGLHHVHHLGSRIPNYRLQACLDASPELRRHAKRITLRESVRCWRMSLWDEDNLRMIGFGDLRSRSSLGIPATHASFTPSPLPLGLLDRPE